MAALPATASAQVDACIADFDTEASAKRRLAEDYAPIYFAAPTERYLPTVPFFSAFDSLDNNGDGKRDAEDLQEIAPTALGSNPSTSWDSIEAYYVAPPQDEGGEIREIPVAIFYRVHRITPHSTDETRLWRYLRNDEQAWKRTRWSTLTMDSIQNRMRNTQGFIVLQYYAYYVNDAGLKGHQYDIEPVFVFLPNECDRQPAAPVTDSVSPTDFRIIVGAGHTQSVPNNVLVLMGDRAVATDQRPRILIEFGDHSSAPDAPPYRRIRPAWDINWHVRYIWGTRDTQGSHALNYLGGYDLDMTFPRDTATRNVDLFPPAEEPSDKGGSQKDRPTRYYSLIRAQLMQSLFTMLQATDTGSTIVPAAQRYRLLRIIKNIAGELGSTQYRRWNVYSYVTLFDADSVAFSDAVHAMQRWLGPQVVQDGADVDPTHFRVWESEHYKGDNSRIFKPHLYRPTSNQMEGFRDWWGWLTNPRPTFSLLSMGRYRAGLGWAIPAMDMPVRLPGVLEIHAGLYGKVFQGLTGPFPLNPVPFDEIWDRHLPTAWATYEHQYGQKLTWFVEVAKIWNRGHEGWDKDRSSWTAEGGVSLGLNPNPKTRLRIGPRLDLAKSVYMDWMVQLSWVR